MARFARILLVVLGVLVVAGLGAFYYYTARETAPETSTFAFDLEKIRAASREISGRLPRQVRTLLISEGSMPRAAIFAGESFEAHPIVHQVFQVTFPEGFVLIDSAFDRAAHEAMSDGPFHEEAYGSLQRAIADAEQIFITHEHQDHIGGVARHEPISDLFGNLQLTQEQLTNTAWLDAIDFPTELRRRLEPIAYDEYLAVAPGVVLIKAAGHTLGTQMIYVRDASRREYLFLGDVAWHMDQVRNLHYRPRFVTDLLLGEDRDAVLNQLRSLHDLLNAEPGLTQIASHDPEQRDDLLTRGLLLEGFAD